MKRFWKKTNRGLWLGGILILILIAFIVIKEIQLRTEAPVIAERAREAAVSLIKLNLSPKDAKLSSPLSEGSVKEKREELEAYLGAFWDADPPSSSLYYMYTGANDVRLGFEELLLKDVSTIFYDVDVEIPDSAIEVKANGPDYALVYFELNRVSATFAGDGEQLFCGTYDWESMAKSGDSEVFLGNYRGYATMEMHRVRGEWRVCGISMYLNLYGKTATELAGGGK